MPTDRKAIDALLVTAPDCHFCDQGQLMLKELSATFPIVIEVVGLMSDVGRNLVTKHRVPFPPILLLDGELFGYGRLSQRRLERRLTELIAAKAN